MQHFSDYIRMYEGILPGHVVLFHTRTKAVLALEQDYLGGNALQVPEKVRRALKEREFLLSNRQERQIAASLLGDRRLMVSVELSRRCNLRCPYCYQGEASQEALSRERLLEIAAYCERTAARQNAEELIVKILGGEPLLEEEKIGILLPAVEKAAKRLGVPLQVIADTNGTLDLERLTRHVEGKLTLRVPLCQREVHNRTRGAGTFERILDNLNRFHRQRPEGEILLRHNTDHENYRLFGAYLEELRERAEFPLRVELAYTLDAGEYRNQLSYEEFVLWKSGEAVETAVQNGVPVMQAPMMSYGACQYTASGSVKFCADGSILSCPVGEACGEWTAEGSVCVSKEADGRAGCVDCGSFYLCGGILKLPCAAKLGMRCGDWETADNHALSIKTYLGAYIRAAQQGKQALFSTFSGG